MSTFSLSHEIALCYAKVLFNLSCDDTALQTHLNMFKEMIEMENANPSFSLFFSSSQISFDDKKKVFLKHCEQLFNTTFTNWFLIVLKKGHFCQLKEIYIEFKKMVFEKIGLVVAKLTTPKGLSDQLHNELKAKLEKLFSKEVHLIEETDQKLIGGGILLINDHLIDYSIKGKLQRLKKSLTS